MPIIKINIQGTFYFQHDNCSVHTAKVVTKFLKDANVPIIKWPSKSPDLNIVEDVWKMISDIVYDGPQFQNLKDLELKVKNAIEAINCGNRNSILDLYSSLRGRFCKVLQTRGNLYNL